MIFPIGSRKTAPLPCRVRQRKGLSFIELMMTIVVISSGLVFVYKAFFISLTSLNHLTHRLHAMNLMANHIVSMQQDFEITKNFSALSARKTKSIPLANKTVSFQLDTVAQDIGLPEHIYQIEMAVSWREGSRNFRLARFAYIGP